MSADGRGVRIGDAERDEAATTLGQHFAAGRLTKQEFDERADQVAAARFQADLAPLFADLPDVSRPTAPVAKGNSGGAGLSMVIPRLMWALPVMAIGLLVITVLVGAPWLLFMLFWFCALGGCGHRRAYRSQLRSAHAPFAQQGHRRHR